jgi:hypothetical protein
LNQDSQRVQCSARVSKDVTLTGVAAYRFHLDALEAESIFVMRDVGPVRAPGPLFSGGVD